jgi:hypothetical protein
VSLRDRKRAIERGLRGHNDEKRNARRESQVWPVGEGDTKVRKRQEKRKLTNRKTEKRTTARWFYLLSILLGEGRGHTNKRKKESETAKSRMMLPATDPNGDVDEERRCPNSRKIY